MTAVPYDWLKELSPELLTYDNVPLFGKAPAFPWEQFSKKLSEVFGIESIKLTPGELKWRTENELQQDIGDNVRIQHLSAASFSGEICWLMAEQDIVYLMTSLLLKKSVTELEEFDEDFEAGFWRFLGVECINALTLVDFEKTLTPHLIDKDEPLKGPALCQDVHISLFDHAFVGRLVISPEFRASWKDHHVNKKIAVTIPTGAMGKITLPIHLQIGTSFLSREEIQRLKPGDLLLLDKFTLDASGTAGKVLLTLHNRPMLEADLKSGNLTISESPIYQEVLTDMKVEHLKEETPILDPIIEREEEEEEEEEDEDDEEEFTFEDLDEEFDFDEETTEEGEDKAKKGESSEDSKKTSTAATPPLGKPATPNPTQAAAKPQPAAAVAPSKATNPSTPPQGTLTLEPGVKTNLAEAGLHVVIEIGRLQIPLQRLLELQKGNVLELGIKPEAGVDLVVSGTCIGKGELVKIGDTLGIRILDIGA